MAAAEGPGFRQRVYAILELDDRQSVLPRVFATGLIVLILVNVVAAVFETVPEIAASHRRLFSAIEAVSFIVFTVEYAVRVWIAVDGPRARGMSPLRARLTYVVTPAAIIDLVAILPFVVEVIWPDASLRVLVLLRLLRLFKLGRYSTGFQSLFEAVRRERNALLASFLILFSAVLVAASLAYMAERAVQPEDFGSIPQAVWWAMETVTTVGYGDVVPKTTLGRIVAGLTMVTGILMIALPVAIIGSSFAEVVRQRSFIVTFGMVARLPLFANLDTRILGDLMPHLRAISAEPGGEIIEAGGVGDDFFVIADGLVEVDSQGNRRRLSEGAAFGSGPDGPAPPGFFAIAVTRSKLLAIDRLELVRLCERYPDLAGRLRRGAES